MMRPKCQCQRHDETRDFDFESAYRRLSSQVKRLAECMQTYVREEATDRSADSESGRMAAMLERIVGGAPTASGTFAECCLVGRTAQNGTTSWFCTGVLVHKRIVLTAAHCHQPPSPRVNVVALRADDMNSLGSANIVPVRRAVSNPQYPLTGTNDIAVLILKRDAQVDPVAVATTAEIGAATKTTLVGFGNSDTLSSRGFGRKRKVTVPITNLRRTQSDDFDDAEAELGFESDLEFTAGGDGFDSCNGDSGGPAYIQVGNVRKLAGLTSSAFDRATTPCGEGGIYTRVDKQLDFIRAVAAAADLTF